MIEITNLNKIYGANDAPDKQTVALHDVNLTIQTGDIFGIIGMSGAGKSTLLRCLSMLEKPSSGAIFLDGVELTSLTGKSKRAAHQQMGVVFQGYNLLMQQTVFDNIAFPLKISGTPKNMVQGRVTELLSMVGLSDKSTAYPSQLSGGQKQRVAIARALATNPQVLLCDEPTSALDSLTTRSVLTFLQDINAKLGVTIIIITHDISVVESICSQVAVIDNGKIAETGRKDLVFSNPQSNITRMLLNLEEIPYA